MRDDPLRVEHHQMRVLNGHQRRQKENLGIFEIVVEYVGHVLGSKRHQPEYSNSCLHSRCEAGLLMASARIRSRLGTATSLPATSKTPRTIPAATPRRSARRRLRRKSQ